MGCDLVVCSDWCVLGVVLDVASGTSAGPGRLGEGDVLRSARSGDGFQAGSAGRGAVHRVLIPLFEFVRADRCQVGEGPDAGGCRVPGARLAAGHQAAHAAAVRVVPCGERRPTPGVASFSFVHCYSNRTVPHPGGPRTGRCRVRTLSRTGCPDSVRAGGARCWGMSDGEFGHGVRRRARTGCPGVSVLGGRGGPPSASAPARTGERGRASQLREAALPFSA